MDIGKLRAQLVKHEGLKLKVYNDTMGIPTIGVGHNLKVSPLHLDPSQPYGVPKDGLTHDQAMTILDGDIANTVHFLEGHCSWWSPLDECRQRAIVDITFNLMGKILGFNNMIAAIQVKDWNRASAELLSSTFAHQVGHRAIDISIQLLTGKD